MSEEKRITKWVTVPIRFWVSAKNQDAFDEAMERITKEVWMSMTSSDGFSIKSEAAKNKNE